MKPVVFDAQAFEGMPTACRQIDYERFHWETTVLVCKLATHARAHRDAEHEPLDEPAAAEFLGAASGFLVGPWSTKVHPADAQRIGDHLRAVFSDKSLAVFDPSKAAVGERFEKLTQIHRERSQAELAAKSKQREKAKQAVAQADQSLDAKQQTLKDKEKKRDRDAQTPAARP